MIDGQFANAFTIGLVAVVNPCGFAMLPAYLSFFLGVEGQDDDTRAGLARAFAVGLSVSAGFVATFALITAVIRNLFGDVVKFSPWLTIVIGVALVGLGAWLLSGRELGLRLPRLDRGGGSGSVRSMALYGVSYAVVSLGCTIPTFIAIVVGTINTESWLSASLVFLAYASGFTLLLTSLTIGVALGRQGLLRLLRQALPYLQRISGGLVMIAGLYVTYYGWYELQIFNDRSAPDGPARRVDSWSTDFTARLLDFGGIRFGLLLALLVAAAAIVVASRRRSAT